jgi:hypothetical protein
MKRAFIMGLLLHARCLGAKRRKALALSCMPRSFFAETWLIVLEKGGANAVPMGSFGGEGMETIRRI